jgi:hypothetical protein
MPAAGVNVPLFAARWLGETTHSQAAQGARCKDGQGPRAGSGISFTDRGTHQLPEIADPGPVFAVSEASMGG